MLIAGLLAASVWLGQDVKPLTMAHAHNDYLHAAPLTDALANGFCSVEADVFLVEGELRVGHTLAETQPGRTLQSLYLDPLLARVKANSGSVYKEKAPFQLLVDVKADGQKVVEELEKVLPKYAEMLSETGHDGSVETSLTPWERRLKAVTVVISGDRPAGLFAPGPVRRLMFVDGRLDDLSISTERIPSAMPLVSADYTTSFTWRGEGEMPERERTKLRWLVQKAHLAGLKIRFWAIPDSRSGWREMMDAGVDFVNTDKLAEFREYAATR